MNTIRKKMEYFFIYILKCNDDSYYIGQTDNIEKRISEHNLGKIAGYTSKDFLLRVFLFRVLAQELRL